MKACADHTNRSTTSPLLSTPKKPAEVDHKSTNEQKAPTNSKHNKSNDREMDVISKQLPLMAWEQVYEPNPPKFTESEAKFHKNWAKFGFKKKVIGVPIVRTLHGDLSTKSHQ